MPNQTWSGVDIDVSMLPDRGYAEIITVNGLPYQRFIGYMIAGLAAVVGISSGYKIASGETVLDGSGPTLINPGLSTVVAVNLRLKGVSSPGLGTSVLTYDIFAGNLISAYPWKPTSSSNPTLVASNGTETVGWIAIGT